MWITQWSRVGSAAVVMRGMGARSESVNVCNERVRSQCGVVA